MLSYEGDDGVTQASNYDDATSIASAGDRSLPYTYDLDTSTLCAQSQAGDNCITFEDAGEKPASSDAGFLLEGNQIFVNYKSLSRLAWSIFNQL